MLHIGQDLLSWTNSSVHSPQKAFSHSLHYFGSFKIIVQIEHVPSSKIVAAKLFSSKISYSVPSFVRGWLGFF
jgi:hypothetical protein